MPRGAPRAAPSAADRFYGVKAAPAAPTGLADGLPNTSRRSTRFRRAPTQYPGILVPTNNILRNGRGMPRVGLLDLSNEALRIVVQEGGFSRAELGVLMLINKNLAGFFASLMVQGVVLETDNTLRLHASLLAGPHRALALTTFSLCTQDLPRHGRRSAYTTEKYWRAISGILKLAVNVEHVDLEWHGHWSFLIGTIEMAGVLTGLNKLKQLRWIQPWGVAPRPSLTTILESLHQDVRLKSFTYSNPGPQRALSASCLTDAVSIVEDLALECRSFDGVDAIVKASSRLRCFKESGSGPFSALTAAVKTPTLVSLGSSLVELVLSHGRDVDWVGFLRATSCLRKFAVIQDSAYGRCLSSTWSMSNEALAALPTTLHTLHLEAVALTMSRLVRRLPFLAALEIVDLRGVEPIKAEREDDREGRCLPRSQRERRDKQHRFQCAVQAAAFLSSAVDLQVFCQSRAIALNLDTSPFVHYLADSLAAED